MGNKSQKDIKNKLV